MNTPIDPRIAANAANADDADRHELAPRARTVGVVTWCSFLSACLATTITFAFVNPDALPFDLVPPWPNRNLAVYALGFFLFWAVCALSSALTIYMAHTEHAPPAL